MDKTKSRPKTPNSSKGLAAPPSTEQRRRSSRLMRNIVFDPLSLSSTSQDCQQYTVRQYLENNVESSSPTERSEDGEAEWEDWGSVQMRVLIKRRGMHTPMPTTPPTELTDSESENVENRESEGGFAVGKSTGSPRTSGGSQRRPKRPKTHGRQRPDAVEAGPPSTQRPSIPKYVMPAKAPPTPPSSDERPDYRSALSESNDAAIPTLSRPKSKLPSPIPPYRNSPSSRRASEVKSAFVQQMTEMREERLHMDEHQLRAEELSHSGEPPAVQGRPAVRERPASKRPALKRPAVRGQRRDTLGRKFYSGVRKVRRFMWRNRWNIAGVAVGSVAGWLAAPHVAAALSANATPRSLTLENYLRASETSAAVSRLAMSFSVTRVGDIDRGLAWGRSTVETMSTTPVQTLINTNADVGGFSNILAWEEMNSWGSATKAVPAMMQTQETVDEAMPLADEPVPLTDEPMPLTDEAMPHADELIVPTDETMPPADDLPPAAPEVDTPPRRSSKRARTDLSAYRKKAAELQAAIDDAWKHLALKKKRRVGDCLT
ncbi:hypothetical protein N0V94_002148 [Neodidymelliopsis sp. IMI 364377]|nr:hypothetical protein N0V94_002148 [Neodidymelliopsis sp. IMI 364377]